MKNRVRGRFVLVTGFFLFSGLHLMQSTAGGLEYSNGGSVLDLETAQRIALKQNPSIMAAKQRVMQAKERIAQARAAYWPRLDASASMSRIELSENEEQRATPAGIDSSGFFFALDNPEDFYDVSLNASWVLFDGFERKFNTSAARFGRLESKAAENESKRLLLAAVSQAYFNALLARENIRITEADRVFNSKQLKDAQARLRVGAGPLSDVLNFEVQINTAKSNWIAAKESYQVALYALASLMGISEADFRPDMKLASLEGETSSEMEAPAAELLVRSAEDFRPDLDAAEYSMMRTDQQIGIAKSDFFPTVQISGSLSGERVNDARLSTDDFGNSVVLSLSYNIFSGGLHRARVSEARYRKKEAERSFENTMITVKREVREALAILLSAQEQLVLQRSNAKLVRRNRDLVEKEYAAGQTSLVRLNEAQRDLTSAEARLALALVSLRQAWQDVKAATGEILLPFENADMDRRKVKAWETKGMDS